MSYQSSTSQRSEQVWIVIPNSGSGSRMGGKQPKQYEVIGSKTLIEWTISAIAGIEQCQGVVLINSETDLTWDKLQFKCSREIHTVTGGSQRVDSVYNGLLKVNELTAGKGWALVHDAARPLVDSKSVSNLISQCFENKIGGILANRVVDTLKVSEGKHVLKTIPRNSIWQAQTPQLFPVKLLIDAIDFARKQDIEITDESSAVENFGHPILIVESARSNIKVTYPEDLEFIKHALLSNTK